MRTTCGSGIGRRRLEPDDEQSSRPVLRGLGLGNGARLPDTSFLGGGSVYTPGTGWNVAGVGDFNGDDKSDILFQDTTGKVAVWLMDGTTVLNAATIANGTGGWHVAAIGDYNADHKSDILWRHDPVAGQSWSELQVWTMDGLSATAGTLAYPSNDWQVIA